MWGKRFWSGMERRFKRIKEKDSALSFRRAVVVKLKPGHRH